MRCFVKGVNVHSVLHFLLFAVFLMFSIKILVVYRKNISALLHWHIKAFNNIFPGAIYCIGNHQPYNFDLNIIFPLVYMKELWLALRAKDRNDKSFKPLHSVKLQNAWYKSLI